jgi:glycosyltransferase involved in cell wall biosynthesis
MRKLLLNASNLHKGGGVQVATSVIYEISNLPEVPANLTIWASSEVHRNLLGLGWQPRCAERYEVVDSHPLEQLRTTFRQRISSFDTVFTVFGPLYTLPKPPTSIVGFAQPWIIYPENELYSRMPIFSRLGTRIKWFLQKRFFRLADVLVVELDHVKKRLSELDIHPSARIHVVQNCVSSVYLRRELWSKISMTSSTSELKIGFVGQNYLHKNTSVFPRVAQILADQYGIKTSFYVTFSTDEWLNATPEFKTATRNVGNLRVAECPQFYQAMDGVICPSLLECFSAAPLEAMIMRRPLFVADRPFNRDICGGTAHYFDPCDPTSIAASIARYYSAPEASALMVEAAYARAKGFANAKDRACEYLRLLAEEGATKRPHTCPEQPLV